MESSMAVSDTGESTADINRRDDAESWAKIRPMMEQGTTLRHGGHSLRRYYTVEPGGQFGAVGIRQEKVKKLAEDGTLVLVGVQTYALKGQPI